MKTTKTLNDRQSNEQMVSLTKPTLANLKQEMNLKAMINGLFVRIGG